MIRRLLDEIPDDPTATEATAQAVQLNRIEGYLSRDMVPSVERAVAESQEPLVKRIAELEEMLRALISKVEDLTAETAQSNHALGEIITAIHAEEAAGRSRPSDKSILKKLKDWVDEGDR